MVLFSEIEFQCSICEAVDYEFGTFLVIEAVILGRDSKVPKRDIKTLARWSTEFSSIKCDSTAEDFFDIVR